MGVESFVLGSGDPDWRENPKLRALVEEYKERWRKMGAKEGLIDKAVLLAEEYAKRMASWMSKFTEISPEELEPGIFSYAIKNVADEWVKAFV